MRMESLKERNYFYEWQNYILYFDKIIIEK